MCMQVKELINMRDRCTNGIFKSRECNDIFLFWIVKCCLIIENKEHQTKHPVLHDTHEYSCVCPERIQLSLTSYVST